MDLRDAASHHVPPLEKTAQPGEIKARERALADAIRTARPDAKAGDVFGDARDALVATVRADFAKRTPAERRAVLGELPAAAVPAVNQGYPEGRPLLTVPPALLDALPALPKAIEYRLVGPHLILRDVEANLVVDVIPDAVGAAAP